MDLLKEILLPGIVLAGNIHNAEELLHRLQAVKEHFTARYRKRLSALSKNIFDKLTVHHFDSSVPRDNNITKNINKQLNGKLKAVEIFKSKFSALS